jgi:hypothetical protein
MNKKGAEMNLIVKILLLVTGFVTAFSGVNSLWISTGRKSLVRAITSNVELSMQILYVIIGISSLITIGVLIIKIFKR